MIYHSLEWYTVSVRGQENGSTVKYSPLSEGVPEGKSPKGGLYSTVNLKLGPTMDII